MTKRPTTFFFLRPTMTMLVKQKFFFFGALQTTNELKFNKKYEQSNQKTNLEKKKKTIAKITFQNNLGEIFVQNDYYGLIQFLNLTLKKGVER